MTRKALCVLDADIRRFFDSVNHEWLLRMLSHRIADPRVLRLIPFACKNACNNDPLRGGFRVR